MFKAQSEGAEADLTAPQKVGGPPFETDEPGPPARIQSAATYIGENKLAVEAERIRQTAGHTKQTPGQRSLSEEDKNRPGAFLHEVAAAGRKGASGLANIGQRGVERLGSATIKVKSAIKRSMSGGKE